MNPINLLLWSLFIFFLTILIGIIVNKTDYFLSEGFGTQCIDYIPFKGHDYYPIKQDTIFVSIASYRDEECSMTLDTLFNNAKYPEYVFVGICEQNKEGITKELCMSNKVMKYRNNIRITTMDHKKAKGPTYARFYCANLWRGEQYYLQIDSHTTFVKNWDTDLISMIMQIKIGHSI